MENENVRNLELKPVYKNIIIDVYDTNPYVRQKTEDGLDLNSDFVNSDSGQVEEKNLVIECAKVMEVGPDCEYVCAGDDVLVDVRALSPIPFLGHYYWLLNEQAVKAVIAEGLTERFKK